MPRDSARAFADADPLELVLEQLHEAVATAKRPAAVVVAERTLTAARDRRAELVAQLDLAVAEAREGGSASIGAARRIADLEVQRRDADEAVNAARQRLTAARTAWAPALHAALHPHRRVAAQAIVTALQTIEAASAVLRAADDLAERQGVGRPHPPCHVIVDRVGAEAARRLAQG